MDCKENFFGYLKEKGLKITPEREKLLNAVNAFKGHFDAEELAAKMSRSDNAISRASVYRNIPLLVESGVISESIKKEGRTFYEVCFNHSHHDHLLCEKCGKIVEFKNEEIEELQKKVCKKHGFVMSEHHHVIKGLCDKCKN